MKRAIKLPALDELVLLLNEEAYWMQGNKEAPKELLQLKKATASLETLAEAAKKLNTKTAFYTPKPYLRELYTLIIAVHQNETKALSLFLDIKFKIDVWRWEQLLALALQSHDITAESKAYLELGLLYQHSSVEMPYEQALGCFSKVIKLGHEQHKAIALRKRAELHLERGNQTLGLEDFEASCRLDTHNPRAYIEYGRALILAERYREAEKAAKQALALKPDERSASDLLQTAQRYLSKQVAQAPKELKIQASELNEGSISPSYQNRDERHALYLERLNSKVPEEREDSFRQLMEKLKPCIRETSRLEEIMSQANFEKLLASAPAYFEAEMPSHADSLKTGFKQSNQSFDDCLMLYLLAKSFTPLPHQTKFYSNISRLLAKKGYYYQYAPIKNTGQPLDAFDYGTLVLPYGSPDLLPYYQGGVEQIAMEYHYHQSIVILGLLKTAVQNYHVKSNAKDIKDIDIEAAVEPFLKQFSLLLELLKKLEQYHDSSVMQGLGQEYRDYLSSSVLLETFKKSFRFKLKHCKNEAQLLENACKPFWRLMDLWSQYDAPNAIKALREFEKHLTNNLSQNPFYLIAAEHTNALLLPLEKNETSLKQTPQRCADIKALVEETRQHCAKLLSVGTDLNTFPVMILQKRISDEAIVILNNLLSTIENNLGPVPCAFSILGLGSYSREDMSLCSDIDFAILISDESCREHPYFKHFLWMWEHLCRSLPPNVLPIESKDLQTLFSREKSLMHTPKGMVLEHCPPYSLAKIKNQKNRLSNTESYSVRRARLIFNSQTQFQDSKTLFEDYQSRLTKQLQSIDSESSTPYYQWVGQVCLEEDFKKQKGQELINSAPGQGTLENIDLKKTHIRPLTLWLLDVATYFGIPAQSIWSILDTLETQALIAPIFLKELREALTTLYTLRLKLHHAWLTQPRPEGASFDTWLAMPPDYNTFLPTRDFYLDPAQRETLDAIQRRIIEPLTETISVFGASLPPSQFDPAVQYFEQQFEALGECKLRLMSADNHKYDNAIMQGKEIALIKNECSIRLTLNEIKNFEEVIKKGDEIIIAKINDEFKIFYRNKVNGEIDNFNCSENLKALLLSLTFNGKLIDKTQHENIYQLVYEEVTSKGGYTNGFKVLCRSAKNNDIICFKCSETLGEALKKEFVSLKIDSEAPTELLVKSKSKSTERIYELVYKEVKSNRGYTLEDKKLTIELHSKVLPALAEIALRRPLLLTPTPRFRDLQPKLKIAYLDALEVMKESSFEKETAELKALKALWHYPTEDGWRAESFRQERAWHQQLMRLISTEAPSPISNTLSLVQGNRLRHYTLKSEIASQLFTEQGAWLAKDETTTGNHLVYRIMGSKTETLCWAKVYPEQPGIEWLMLNLDQRLGIYGIPCSTLVNLHHHGRSSAVLFSAHVPYPNLVETLKTAPQVLANLDRAHFFKTLMRVLLTNPEDDKGNDYFLAAENDGLKLIRIDNERAFFTPELSEGILKISKLQVKSIIYCLDLLMEPIKSGSPNVDAAIWDFLQLKPYALLKSLLLELKALQPLWQSLFSESDIEAHYHNKKPWLSLPVLYVPQELVKELSVRMESLQSLLFLSPKTTGLKLLSTVQPKLAAHYLEGFKQCQNNQNAYSQVMARFDLSPGRYYKKEEQGLFSLHGTEAVTQSLRLSGELSLKTVKSIWQGKAYTADTVLEQIEQWEADRSKEIYNGLLHPDPIFQKKAYAGWQQLPNRQRVLLLKDFSDGIRKNATVDTRLQKAILAVLPETTFHTLDLSAFHASLEDKLLIPILKAGGAHLIELTLNGCQNLSEAIPRFIAEHCPNLKILNASNMTWKSFSTGFIGRSAIALPSLERLEMQDCASLEYFMVETTPQADINLQNCPALKHVQFSSDSSIALAKQSEPGEFQYQLAKAYLLGKGTLQNPIQAYYWARLSHEHQHSLSSILCYALFNFYNVMPLNGSDESLAAEKAVLSLVGESLFTSIQTLKSADVKAFRLENMNLPLLSLLDLALGGNIALQQLDLSFSKLGSAGAALLGAALKANSTLQHLDLSGNDIGDKGADAIGEVLKVNSMLQHLDLEGNNISPKGVEVIGLALKVNSTLQHLNLRGNNIGLAGAEALSKALETNGTLQYLNLLSTDAIDRARDYVWSGENELELAIEYAKITNRLRRGVGLLDESERLRRERGTRALHYHGEGKEIIDKINDILAKNKQKAEKEAALQKPPITPLAKKDDAPSPLLEFQYPESIANKKPIINKTYQYEDNDIQAILAARLQQLRTQNAGLFINPIAILAAVDNIAVLELESRLRQEAKCNKGARTLLIPCNLGEAHWTGILLVFSTEGQILRAEYIDSLTTDTAVPETFQVQLWKVYPTACFRTRSLLHQDDYTSCGAYTIENLLTMALGIPSFETTAEAIRSLHLATLRQYSPTFYSAFNERQRNNRPTTASLHEQLGYLDRLKGIWFSKPELNRILAIKCCLYHLPGELQMILLGAFQYNPAYKDNHALHLDTIRKVLEEASQFESKILGELMQLLFGNWVPGDSLILDNIKFRVSYNEILAITQCELAIDQMSTLQQNLAEQIKQDEEFARNLQAELWRDGEPRPFPLVAERQASSSNEQADTDSSAWIEPLAYLRRSNTSSNGQTSVISTEEKQPGVLQERPKPVFRSNIGGGL